MPFILFLVVGFGATHALVFLHVFHWLRRLVSGISDREFSRAARWRQGKRLRGFRQEYLGRLVRCHACTGFWVGVSLSLFHGSFISEYMVLPFPADVMGDGIVLSCFSFCLWVVLRKLGAEEL